jgi:hypothetical protein
VDTDEGLRRTFEFFRDKLRGGGAGKVVSG